VQFDTVEPRSPPELSGSTSPRRVAAPSSSNAPAPPSALRVHLWSHVPAKRPHGSLREFSCFWLASRSSGRALLHAWPAVISRQLSMLPRAARIQCPPNCIATADTSSLRAPYSSRRLPRPFRSPGHHLRKNGTLHPPATRHRFRASLNPFSGMPASPFSCPLLGILHCAFIWARPQIPLRGIPCWSAGIRSGSCSPGLAACALSLLPLLAEAVWGAPLLRVQLSVQIPVSSSRILHRYAARSRGSTCQSNDISGTRSAKFARLQLQPNVLLFPERTPFTDAEASGFPVFRVAFYPRSAC
jgi:hypothetical protein